MVSGIQFVVSLLFWMGMLFGFLGFVSACMQSRQSVSPEQTRSWISLKFENLGTAPLGSLLLVSLRLFRDVIDCAVSQLMTKFEISPFAASVVMSILSVLLPLAALVNALVGGAPFLFLVYVFILLVIVFAAVLRADRVSSALLGALSVLATFCWLVFAPLYSVHSLTGHILLGTFSHAVLGSLIVAVVLYSGCAGVWLIYRSIRSGKKLSHMDLFLARFLLAVPAMYVLYWFGLLAGHFAVNDPSPERNWRDLLTVVVVGAISFSSIIASVEWGVRENRRGHGLAVVLSGLVLSLAGAVATHGLTAQELPVWLQLWHYGFSFQQVQLGPSFWTSHAVVFVWASMMSIIFFAVVARFVVFVWPEADLAVRDKSYLMMGSALGVCAIVLFCVSAFIDVYVNVN